MAVKIIKPGQTEFNGFCDRCGCEFTYELADLKLSHANRVACPTCGQDVYHVNFVKKQEIQPSIYKGLQDLSWPPEPIPCIDPNDTNTDPCAGCAWKEHMKQNEVYIGDTPCTWCNKNRFNSIISTGQSTLKQYTTPYVNNLDAHLASTSRTSKDVASTYTSPEDITQGVVMQTILNACGCAHADTEGKATETAVKAAQANCNHTLCDSKKNCKARH